MSNSSMCKYVLSVFLAVLAVTVARAQSVVDYPHTWDFSVWSDETKAALESDENWRVYDGGMQYFYRGSCPVDSTIELEAGGKALPETQGLLFAVANVKKGAGYAGSFSICRNYMTMEMSLTVTTPDSFYFVIPRLTRGQKVVMKFKAYSNDGTPVNWPESENLVLYSDKGGKVDAEYSKNGTLEYVVKEDGDAVVHTDAKGMFELHSISVGTVDDGLLQWLDHPDGINAQLNSSVAWNGSQSSTVTPWGSSFARGVDATLTNGSGQAVNITSVEVILAWQNIGTVSELIGVLAAGETKTASFSLTSPSAMPSVLPWLNIYYEIDGVQYMKSTMDDASGIQSPVHSSTSAAGAVFSLDGRRLPDVPTRKGIYISQGRKFVVR